MCRVGIWNNKYMNFFHDYDKSKLNSFILAIVASVVFFLIVIFFIILIIPNGS